MSFTLDCHRSFNTMVMDRLKEPQYFFENKSFGRAKSLTFYAPRQIIVKISNEGERRGLVTDYVIRSHDIEKKSLRAFIKRGQVGQGQGRKLQGK